MSDIGIGSPRLPASPPPSIVKLSPPDIAQRRSASWSAIQADTIQVTRREPFEYKFQAWRHLLIAYERAARDDGETVIEGLPKSTLREFSRTLSVVPAGHQFYGWQTPRVLTRATCFYIDPRGPLLDPESGVTGPTIRPRLFFFDQTLWDTALKLKAESGNSDPGNRQYAEVVSLMLMHELARLERAGSRVATPVRGGLAMWQQKRVSELIEENVGEEISLATLAELTRLSLYHFARAFRQSFGVPPHRYHLARRMERAKILLEKPAMSVMQIGVQIGFREASSFATAFRRATGITPTDYRRQLN